VRRSLLTLCSVTNTSYARCVSVGVCTDPKVLQSLTRNNYYGNSEFDKFPVISVDWYQARQYCEWRTARLPTEAEWDKAGDGTGNRPEYIWGDVSENKGVWQIALKDTTEVGVYPENKSVYGAYDMNSNVWEWVNDWYSPTY